jgi:hypothetical protein
VFALEEPLMTGREWRQRAGRHAARPDLIVSGRPKSRADVTEWLMREEPTPPVWESTLLGPGDAEEMIRNFWRDNPLHIYELPRKWAVAFMVGLVLTMVLIFVALIAWKGGGLSWFHGMSANPASWFANPFG